MFELQIHSIGHASTMDPLMAYVRKYCLVKLHTPDNYLQVISHEARTVSGDLRAYPKIIQECVLKTCVSIKTTSNISQHER